MGYNPNIRLDPKQLNLIEQALQSEVTRLAVPPSEEPAKTDDHFNAVREINDLLAHLHHQKWWYRPKAAVPMG